MSFFNHDILEYIIKVEGDDNDKKRLETFKNAFKKFCQRKVFEISPKVVSSGIEKKICKPFVVVATQDLIKNLADVQKAKSRIASLLRLNVSTQIDISSVILVFLIPHFVSQQVFPLSTAVHSELKSCGYTVFVPDMPISVMEDILKGLLLLDHLSLSLVTTLQTILKLPLPSPEVSLSASRFSSQILGLRLFTCLVMSLVAVRIPDEAHDVYNIKQRAHRKGHSNIFQKYPPLIIYY